MLPPHCHVLKEISVNNKNNLYQNKACFVAGEIFDGQFFTFLSSIVQFVFFFLLEKGTSIKCKGALNQKHNNKEKNLP